MEAPLVLVIIGFLGAAAITLAFPLLALALYQFRRSQGLRTSEQNPSLKLAVLIPAHNEAEQLARTIESIHQAADVSFKVRRSFDVSVIVAADGCDDQTATIARKQRAQVFEQRERLGKWRTLLNLIENLPTDIAWVGIVDAGSEWSHGTLDTLQKEFFRSDIVGIAPGYENLSAGLFGRLAWRVERTLKQLENLSGGPVSVHGATVFYRRAELLSALAFLQGQRWINDDVVIPLVLRTLSPEKRIQYRPDVVVRDAGAKVQSGELRRRKRIVTGNLQWIINLTPRVAQLNFIPLCLCMRRVARVFWAYWLLALLIGGLSLTLNVSALLICCGLLSSALIFRRLRGGRMLEALLYPSLLTPIYVFSRREAHWK